MPWHLISKRGLQLYCLLSALVAIIGGGMFVVFGMAAVPRVVGVEYAALVNALSNSVGAIDSSVRVTFDTWYRALGWYWLMAGVMLLWVTPRVDEETAWFRFINVGFMAVGVAAAVTIAQSGTNVHNRFGALVPEFGIPLLAIVWQYFVAKTPKGASFGAAHG